MSSLVRSILALLQFYAVEWGIRAVGGLVVTLLIYVAYLAVVR